jgi:hypothetical protein
MNITDQLARALAEAINEESEKARNWYSVEKYCQPLWYADAIQALAAYSTQENGK